MKPGRSLAAMAVLAVATILGPSATALAQAPRMAESAARQVEALRGIKMSRSATDQKISSRLYYAVLSQRADPRLAALPDFRFVKPNADGTILVDIDTTIGAATKPVVSAIDALGGSTTSVSARYRSIRARVPLDKVTTLAARTDVLKIQLAQPMLTSKINTSEGDVTHRAAAARNFFGVDGTGMKVCVLSDGVDSLAALQASGDLPAVDVLPGQAGSGDEGSAMLEIVHDLAPGATLGFATALSTPADFAQNILDLRSVAGCDVIVDDIIYLYESPFQDLEIAEAVNTVTADGALYFSSAGNEGNKNDGTSGTWEGNFAASALALPAPMAGAGTAHDFGDGGQSISVAFSAPYAILHWTDPFGTAANDYDLYVLNGTLTTIFDASTDTQDGVGGDDDPIEAIASGVFTGERLMVLQFSGANRMFNLIAFRGELDPARTTSGTTRGHSAAAAAFSVAAVDVATAGGGAFVGGAPNPVETFSADGPRRIFFDVNGNLLPGAPAGDFSATGGVVRQKPDIAAADGVACAAPGFNPFFGTSAAAPHAGAIAALIWQAFPAYTPAQMRTALVSNALDIEAAGIDRDSGAGIVMAYETLLALGAPPAANLTAGAAVRAQVAGDGDAYIENGEDWSLTIPLTNAGGAGATAISAVLASSTPGVFILSGASAYADLPSAASGNNTTPFVFGVGSTVPCGATLRFTLTVTYTGGTSPKVFSFTFLNGAPGTPVTFSYTGAAVPIPDGTGSTGTTPGALAFAPLVVSGLTGNVFDVDLRIDGSACNTTVGSTTVGIDHSFVNDLQVSLESPTGTVVMAISNTDGGGNNFCQTFLDDESAGASIQSVVTANAPFTGSFTPNATLSAFDGETANGTWNLRAQDFFGIDTGNIRAFSLIITPALCDAPVAAPVITATKSISGGDQAAGGDVIYTITLTNTGTGGQPDNAGNEFTDLLPAGLVVGTPTASAGTVTGVGVNPVTWNGAIPAGQSVTITIPCDIDPGTTGQSISAQGTALVDANRDGSNETSVLTDAPGGGPNEPTVFIVLAPPAPIVAATKAAAGTRVIGTTVVYTVTLTNSGTADQLDNPGDEFTDTLPALLTVGTPTASSGTVSASGTNPVTWNGTIPAGGSVVITIPATISMSAGGQVISNQGSASFDANNDGINDTNVLTDAPGGTAGDATSFTALTEAAIPTLSGVGLGIAGLLMAWAAIWSLRRIIPTSQG